MTSHSNGHWPMVPLSEICDRIDYGYTAKATADAGGPKFLRITDIVTGQINWPLVPHCEIDDKKRTKYQLLEGDIVIARTGATSGYARQIRGSVDAVFASYLVRIRIKEEHDRRFVGAVIESSSYKDFIRANIGGSAQPQANAQVLTAFPIALPPLNTQRRIADILSAYDDLIENNTRRIAILEEMARALYREWFVHFRFPGHEQAPLVESELGLIPTGWRISSLDDDCKIVMGQSPKSEFYNLDGIGLPFHQGVSNFGHRYPVDRVYCTVANRMAESEDILLSVRAPVGRINIASKRIAIGRGLAAIRRLDGKQVFLFAQMKEQFREGDSMGGGSIFKAVTKRDVAGIKLVEPVESFIAWFTDLVAPLHEQIVILTRMRDILTNTREILLLRLLAGECDLSHRLNVDAL